VEVREEGQVRVMEEVGRETVEAGMVVRGHGVAEV
jgi:hypothetical protein